MDLDRPPDVLVVAAGAYVPAPVPDGCRVIGVDRGVAHALAAGLRVDVAVGDFDSLDPELVLRLDEVVPDVRRHPADKSATDLELALDVARSSAARRVLVTGLGGGRPDHELANLLAIAAPAYEELDIELLLDRGRAWVVRGSLRGAGMTGRIVSVLPVHGAATVSISGVRWPLDRQHLAAGTTHGVSNVVVADDFRLDVHDGAVLCIAPHPEEEP